MTNSNVKWFETATSSLRKVENLTEAINEQENKYFVHNIEKKDNIMEEADVQNEDYQKQIEELDRMIKEKR